MNSNEVHKHYFISPMYRTSAISFRGKYSFLNLTLCTVTFVHSMYRCGNSSREETIQGRKLFAEIRYVCQKREWSRHIKGVEQNSFLAFSSIHEIRGFKKWAENFRCRLVTWDCLEILRIGSLDSLTNLSFFNKYKWVFCRVSQRVNYSHRFWQYLCMYITKKLALQANIFKNF